jgi:hypothetical protein
MWVAGEGDRKYGCSISVFSTYVSGRKGIGGQCPTVYHERVSYRDLTENPKHFLIYLVSQFTIV